MKFLANKSVIGKKGEDLVCKDLQKKGYKLLKRNYFSQQGEIDIIVQKNNVIVFVEVKTRKSIKFGLPAEAVTKSKQQKIIKTAFTYLREEKVINKQYEFTVAEVYLDDKEDLQKINYIHNAFIL